MQLNSNPIENKEETIKQTYSFLFKNYFIHQQPNTPSSMYYWRLVSKLIFEIYLAPFQATAEVASLVCSVNNIEYPTNSKLSSKYF